MKSITVEPEIYTYDIDFNGHVSNISYIKWMEIGRIKLLEAAEMPVHKLESMGLAPILIKTEITYKKPLYLGDKLRIELFIPLLKKTSGEIQFTFYNEKKEIVAEGKQHTLFISLATKRPCKLSEEQRSKFTPYILEK